MGQEGYRSLGKILQGPFRDTVWCRSLADLETHDVFLKLVRVGELGFAGKGQDLRPQCHVKHLNNCRDLRAGHRLKLSRQTGSKGYSFLRV
jgi:hypothetical protein